MDELFFFFFFKQKTAYEIVSRDWSSDVCSSDLSSNPSTSAARQPGTCLPAIDLAVYCASVRAILDSFLSKLDCEAIQN